MKNMPKIAKLGSGNTRIQTQEVDPEVYTLNNKTVKLNDTGS